MSTQLGLFGEVYKERAELAPYHVVGMRDLVSPACAECQHVAIPADLRKGKWICKLARHEIDPDSGTCGKWERWEE